MKLYYFKYNVIFIIILCLILSTCSYGVATSEESEYILSKSSKIIIIGAGMAGISAVVQLKKKGYNNVIIPEARDRIGGISAALVYYLRWLNILYEINVKW